MAKGNKVKHPSRTSSAQPAPRPTHVKVGFYDLAIKWITGENWPKESMPDGLVGQFDASKGIIAIRLDHPDGFAMHEQMMRETLWHEILHACWWHMALSDHPIEKGEEQEEEIIKRITHASLQVVQDNPDVMAYLGAQLWKVKVDG